MLRKLNLLALLGIVSASMMLSGSVVLGSGSGSAAAVTPRIATVMIEFKKRQWRRGDLSTLGFTVTGEVFAGTTPEKVAAFLYISFDPTPFDSPAQPPNFIGILEVPSTVETPVYLGPERNPITEFTRERFVQGAVFNLETGKLEGLSNVAYLDILYEADAETFEIDFQTEDDFTTPLVNGQDISTPPEFGNQFDILSAGTDHFGPAIFDTDPSGPNQFSSDQDLLVDTGNALILQGNSNQSTPGIFNNPDDSAFGGTLSFDFGELQFARHAMMTSIDLIDMCLGANNGSTVTLTDVLGSQVIYSVPPGWTSEVNTDGPPGFGTLDLTTLDPQPGFLATATATGDDEFIPGEVVRIDIELSGSGAVDNFHFEREADPNNSDPEIVGPRKRLR